MSEVASTSINPNVPVGAEATTTSRANSAVTFDDISDAGEASPKAPKPKLVKDDDGEKKESKPRGGAKEERDTFEGVEDDKPEPKAKGEEKSEKDSDAKSKADAKASKPRVHKLKAGEQVHDIAGDAVLTVKIDGNLEERTLQEVINDFSGRESLDRKAKAFLAERTEFTKHRESLNTLVKNLYEKSQTDPEAAWDFMADLTKQDPAKLKIGIVRKQFEEMLPLFDMAPEERERWFKERELDYRDKAHASRQKADEAREVEKAEQAKRAQASEQYGIDEERWTAAENLVKDHLKAQDPKFDGKVTHEQIVWADRHLMALDVIGKTVPHLENNDKFDSIVGDIVHDLVRHPEMNRDKLGKLLLETFGSEDKKGLKELGRKAQKNAQLADDERPQAKSSGTNDPLTFDDLD